MKRLIFSLIFVLTCFFLVGCENEASLDNAATAAAGITSGLTHGSPGAGYETNTEILPTSIEVLAATADFGRFADEIDRLGNGYHGDVAFATIYTNSPDFSLDLMYPVTTDDALNAAIEAVIFAHIDEFKNANDSGFLFARSRVYRHDDRFFSFAIDFRSFGDTDGFLDAIDTLNFDMSAARTIGMRDVFAAVYDFAETLTELAADALGGRQLTGRESFTFDNQNLYLHLGAQTISFATADFGRMWLADTPVRDIGNGPFVALTFDDGPMPPYTTAILDMLKERDIRATFFLLGIQIERHPDLVLRMYEEGHQIGNHSMGHPNFAYLNRTQIIDEIYNTNRLIRDITGYTPTILRPPFGIQDATVLSVAEEFDLSIILWSIDPQDWRYRDAQKVSTHVAQRVIDGSVVLLHDIRQPSVDATLRIIDSLIADGFTFVTINELFEHSAITLESGQVFRSPYRTAGGSQ